MTCARAFVCPRFVVNPSPGLPVSAALARESQVARRPPATHVWDIRGAIHDRLRGIHLRARTKLHQIGECPPPSLWRTGSGGHAAVEFAAAVLEGLAEARRASPCPRPAEPLASHRRPPIGVYPGTRRCTSDRGSLAVTARCSAPARHPAVVTDTHWWVTLLRSGVSV